jgi:Flp pilus assembly protein TadB
MTTTLMMPANGKPRRQLSDQLDRLDAQMDRQDSILDALSAGLNEAVADAAREGVKEAVAAAVVELLTNIELRSALHKATAPPAEAKPNFWQRTKAKVHAAAAAVKGKVSRACSGVAAQVKSVQSAANEVSAQIGLAWRLRKVLVVGLGIGVVVASVSYLASHGLAAVISGAFATATAVGVQVAVWVRRVVRRLAAV